MRENARPALPGLMSKSPDTQPVGDFLFGGLTGVAFAVAFIFWSQG